MTTVVNVRKKELNKRGYSDFMDWNKQKDTVYIGRNMCFMYQVLPNLSGPTPFLLRNTVEINA